MKATSLIDPWQLAPEGALVHPGERLAVLADVHLGYEWTRGRGGDCLPAHSLTETLAKLSRLLTHATIDRVVVAGDLVESARPCRRTIADVASLTHWLADRGVSLVWLAGNHDPRRIPPLLDTFEVDGWTIAHGHRPVVAPRTIRGHDHPVLRADGICAPCFLISPTEIVLPAFSPNAAGCNVTLAPESLPPAWRNPALRCVVACDADLLDFGLLSELRTRLSSH